MSQNESSVIITGASRGIGREIALAFASKTDHPLLLVARSREGLEETRQLCLDRGAGMTGLLLCDTTDPAEVENLEWPDGFPAPGVIVTNAGSFLYKKLANTTPEEFRKQIDINLFSAVHMVSRFLDDLMQVSGARIINICSVSATHGLSDSGAYSASKHALLGYTRSLRKELKHSGVGVTAINLGQTYSTSWEGSDIDPQQLIDPRDVGDLIVSITRLSPRTVVEEILIQPQQGRVPPM